MKKVFLLLVVHLFFLVNLQFTAWPEMVSYPFLVNSGYKLYSGFIHPYPPLLTLILAFLYKFLPVFYWINVLQYFTWGLILINDLLIYKITKLISKDKVAPFVSLLLYVFTQPFLEGNMLWFDVALVTPLLIGTYFLLKNTKSIDLVIAGLFFALGVFVKQTTALAVLVALVFLFINDRSIKKVFLFLLPSFVLGLSFVAWLFATTQFVDFLNWNIIYPFTYWSKFLGYVQMSLTRNQIVIISLLFTPITIMIVKNYKAIFKESSYLLLSALLLVSLVMVYPRFSFFHFQLALAIIAIMFAYLYGKLKLTSGFKYGFLAIYVGIIGFTVCYQSVLRHWGEEPRFWYNDWNRGNFLKTKTTIGEKKTIYLIGVSSATYATSNNVPPPPWAEPFGWYLEIPGMQEKILEKWKNNPPDFILWKKPQDGNWYDLQTYQPKLISDWINTNYSQGNEIFSGVWVWNKKGDDLKGRIYLQ